MGREQISKSSALYGTALLFIAYLFNYMDRMLVSVLTQPIKEDLNLSDTQVGLLTGPAFAITYVSCGFLFAYWADRGHRPTILATALGIWSAATVLCGMAGSFIQLFAMRILVGFGEAGGTPTSLSLIADYFPKERRSSAYSILLAGAPTGILIGSVLAGWVAGHMGWRWAFLLIGAPGILVAGLIALTLKDVRKKQRIPPTGTEADCSNDMAERPVRRMAETLRAMKKSIGAIIRVRSARHLLIAIAVESLLSQGIFAWMPTFFVRYHDMSIEETGRWFGLGSGLGMLAGLLLGGMIADYLIRWRIKMMIVVPILTNALCVPLYFLSFTLPETQSSLAAFIIASVISAIPLSYTMNAYQSAVPADTKSMAGALVMFASSILGIGMASVIIGMISDHIHATTGHDGLSVALMFALLPAAWAILHYCLALKTLEKDIQHAEMSSA